MRSHSLRFPFQFDPGSLKGDLALVEAGDWVPHFNTDAYVGDWSGVALRGPAGATAQGTIYPNPSARNFEPTAILARCRYFQKVLSRFECYLLTVRLLRLRAGSRVREHSDLNLGFEDGEIRVHVPIQTSPLVEFYLDGHRLAMEEGECWYVNTSLRHRVSNRGPEDRVHLVIDCVVNDWVRSFFDASLSHGTV